MSAAAQTLPFPALKNILYATDLAEDSQAAIPYIRVIAEEYGSTVHVVHVLMPEPMLEIPLDIPPELDSDRRVAITKLKKMTSSNPFGSARTTTAVERGHLWNVLQKCVEQEAIDLIVVGTHGRRGFSKMVLGSVAEDIFRASSCPVLTVGPHCAEEPAKGVKIETILLATDFSPSAHHALNYALSLAQANRARLILVHAVPRGLQVVPSGAEIVGETMQIFDEVEAAALFRSHKDMAHLMSGPTMRGWAPETIIEVGNPIEVILSAALKRRADLIVMGAHHRLTSAAASHVPWATASNVVRNAHCPVLTVRS